jgi:hypothetical protein
MVDREWQREGGGSYLDELMACFLQQLSVDVERFDG